jgi:1-acyl-sn-glycerol-3-phosphate acyltransferase
MEDPVDTCTLAHTRRSGKDDPLAAFRPRILAVVAGFLHWFTRLYFRFHLRGAGNLPPGPCLVVGNHSGLGLADVMCLLGAWPRAFAARRAVGLMADSFIRAPLAGWLFRAIGAVPASQKNARRAFDSGHDVIVYPGGELDCCRPFYQPRVVEFGDRRGYVRLALERRVPVVPLATIGSHWTLPMLPGGRLVSCGLHTRRWLRNDRLPLPVTWLVGLAGLAAGLAGWVPWWAAAALGLAGLCLIPARVTSALLPPIDVAALTAHLPDGAERVERAHALVHGALAGAVCKMQHEPRGGDPNPTGVVTKL